MARSIDDIIIELTFIDNYEITLLPEDVEKLNFYIKASNLSFPEIQTTWNIREFIIHIVKDSTNSPMKLVNFMKFLDKFYLIARVSDNDKETLNHMRDLVIEMTASLAFEQKAELEKLQNKLASLKKANNESN